MPSISRENFSSLSQNADILEELTGNSEETTTMATANNDEEIHSFSIQNLNLSSDTLDDDLNSAENSPSLFHRPNSGQKTQSSESLPILPNQKAYDYLLKVLLVGDSDVGKQEILSGLEDGTLDSPFCSSSAGAAYKTTTILIDGKRVKLQLWDTSGQGRFCTIIRSYSRGAQGILLVYDITNKWSFEGIDRWLKEVDQVRLILTEFLFDTSRFYTYFLALAIRSLFALALKSYVVECDVEKQVLIAIQAKLVLR